MIADQPRVVDATRERLQEPADPWEIPGSEADLRDYSVRRTAAHPRRPRDISELPPEAVRDLRVAVGELDLDCLVLLPRAPRPTGTGPRAWAVTPTSVLAVGADAVALWVDGVKGGVVARLPLAEVVAVIDRVILLYGRLEIVGADGSIVVRYNAVGRNDVSGALLEIRRSFWPPALPPAPGLGVDPRGLPHKWMTLLHSRDTRPHGPDGRIVAAGDLQDPRRRFHRGVAVLSSTELMIATEPAARREETPYGVDLVVVPRQRLEAIVAAGHGLVLALVVGGGRIEVRVPAEASLVAATVATLGPAVATR